MTETFLDRGLALVRNGYRIIPIPHKKKGPVEDGWESFEADEQLVHRWFDGFNREDGGFVSYRNGNIGILTSRTPAVDLDILDDAFAREMQREVEQIVDTTLGLPVRIGKAPKRLLLFCCEFLSGLKVPADRDAANGSTTLDISGDVEL
jgi:hypothetical protein